MMKCQKCKKRVAVTYYQNGAHCLGCSERIASSPASCLSVQSLGWTDTPPDSEGLWWLYGDEEFGTMGGNYTGVYPPAEELNVVEIRKLGSRLCGISHGRMISLTPFDAEKRRPGYIGKWRKIDLPPLPSKQEQTK